MTSPFPGLKLFLWHPHVVWKSPVLQNVKEKKKKKKGVCNTFLTNFGALYLSEFLTDLGQILDSKSYDQA